MTREPPQPEDESSLSLVVGGPLYAGYLRCGLARPAIELPRRRIAAFILVCWAPLAVLSLLEGRALSGVGVPFVEHLSVHIRFLISVPLLVVAEVVVHDRIAVAVRQFTDRGLVSPIDRQRFIEIIAAARRLRDSRWVEAALLVVSYTAGTWVWTHYIEMDVQTWHEAAGGGAPGTAAGWWYAFVSLPIARFLLLRWYFRLLIWYWFLWRVSHLPLRLNALHPDRAAGLGFLNDTAYALSPVLVAHTALIAAKIADSIWHEGMTLPQFQTEIVAVLVLLLLLVYAPLLFFVPLLAHARRIALWGYGAFAARYTAAFRAKWLEPPPGARPDSPLGTGDIQSLADLCSSYDVVRGTNLAPVTGQSVVRLTVTIALPLLPLVFTTIPVEQVVEGIIKLVI